MVRPVQVGDQLSLPAQLCCRVCSVPCGMRARCLFHGHSCAEHFLSGVRGAAYTAPHLRGPHGHAQASVRRRLRWAGTHKPRAVPPDLASPPGTSPPLHPKSSPAGSPRGHSNPSRWHPCPKLSPRETATHGECASLEQPMECKHLEIPEGFWGARLSEKRWGLRTSLQAEPQVVLI